MLRWSEDVGGARFAVSDRYGGVSDAPYAELNLGAGSGDEPATVEENRRRLAAALGLPRQQLLFMRQVHGADVVVAGGPWRGEPPAADAVVTTQRGLALAVLTADCVPVLVADDAAGVVGVAHAGRPGLAAGVVPALVAALHRLGARDLVARVGPSVCGRCYEVPERMREEVAALVPEARTVSWTGTPALEVAAGVVAQLAPHCRDLRWLDGCTRESASLYSYRRDGSTGRFAGIAWLAG